MSYDIMICRPGIKLNSCGRLRAADGCMIGNCKQFDKGIQKVNSEKYGIWKVNTEQ
jgi:hypothetical protein